MSENDKWMRRALTVAERGMGHVSPNPLVGCVLVKDGVAIGEGAHEIYGGLHAEANALEHAATLGQDARGATAYVTLEPCNHHGRTSPCTARLVAAGISRCVIAVKDPNPNVAGGGAEALRAVGISVEIGVMESEARDLARFFFKHISTGLPFVTLKIAQSLDGKSARKDGKREWITTEDSQRRVHQMRASFDAVLVGSNTVLIDNPSLTVRLIEARNPIRIILDSNLRIPLSAKVFDGSARTIVSTLEGAIGARASHVEVLRDRGIELVATNSLNGHVDFQLFLRELGQRNIQSILGEAGPTLSGHLLQIGAVDELVIFQSATILGSEWRSSIEVSAPEGTRNPATIKLIESEKIGRRGDCFLRYRVT